MPGTLYRAWAVRGWNSAHVQKAIISTSFAPPTSRMELVFLAKKFNNCSGASNSENNPHALMQTQWHIKIDCDWQTITHEITPRVGWLSICHTQFETIAKRRTSHRHLPIWARHPATLSMATPNSWRCRTGEHTKLWMIYRTEEPDNGKRPRWGASIALNRLGLIKDEISQREAFRVYGESLVRTWLKSRLDNPYKNRVPGKYEK